MQSCQTMQYVSKNANFHLLPKICKKIVKTREVKRRFGGNGILSLLEIMIVPPNRTLFFKSQFNQTSKCFLLPAGSRALNFILTHSRLCSSIHPEYIGGGRGSIEEIQMADKNCWRSIWSIEEIYSLNWGNPNGQEESLIAEDPFDSLRKFINLLWKYIWPRRIENCWRFILSIVEIYLLNY